MYDKKNGITQIIGHIVGQPALTTDEHGNKALSFDITRTDKWTERGTGEKKEVVYTHNCVIEGEEVEVADKYLSIGVEVFVEGTEKPLKEKDILNVSKFSILAANKP